MVSISLWTILTDLILLIKSILGSALWCELRWLRSPRLFGLDNQVYRNLAVILKQLLNLTDK